jgi:hypothetical protein
MSLDLGAGSQDKISICLLYNRMTARLESIRVSVKQDEPADDPARVK